MQPGHLPWGTPQDPTHTSNLSRTPTSPPTAACNKHASPLLSGAVAAAMLHGCKGRQEHTSSRDLPVRRCGRSGQGLPPSARPLSQAKASPCAEAHTAGTAHGAGASRRRQRNQHGRAAGQLGQLGHSTP